MRSVTSKEYLLHTIIILNMLDDTYMEHYKWGTEDDILMYGPKVHICC